MTVLPSITVDSLRREIAIVIQRAASEGVILLFAREWDLKEVAAALRRGDMEELKYISVKFDKWAVRNLTC